MPLPPLDFPLHPRNVESFLGCIRQTPGYGGSVVVLEILNFAYRIISITALKFNIYFI